MATLVLPRVHLLAICDEIEDRWEGDSLHDLLGVRTCLTAPTFPLSCPQLCVYMQATGHVGTAKCRVTVVRADDDLVVVETNEEEITFTGPMDFISIRYWIADCEFPATGVYYIQVFFDGKLRAERAFELRDRG
jgi:hypothetical protein